MGRSAVFGSLLIGLSAWLLLSLLAGQRGADAAQITLSWQDNASNEDGFRIERKVGPGGDYAEIALRDANATSHLDAGLTAGATYCYRVRAFNSHGVSAFSNEACGVATNSGGGETLIVVSAGAGGGPHVRGFTAAGEASDAGFFAYIPTFAGGVHVALGRLNGAATVITGPGSGGGPHVRTFRLDGSPQGLEFMAYDPAFLGGVRVANCDVDGDGTAEIVTAPGPGGGPHVRVWRVTGTDVSELAGFFAYPPAFVGGVHLGCGDVDGDGQAEVITGAGPGGGPHVAAWKIAAGGLVTPVTGFMAYSPTFAGGVVVAAGDVDHDGRAEILTGAGPGGGPHVAVWSLLGGAATPVTSFFAFVPAFTGGVSIAAVDLTGDGRAEVLVGAGPGGGPHVRTFHISGQAVVPGLSFFAFDPTFTGGVWVAGRAP